jgi:hypothetical protein
MSCEIGGASGAGQALVVVLRGAISATGTDPGPCRTGWHKPVMSSPWSSKAWPDSDIDRGRGHALACQGEIAAGLWRPGQRRSELAGAAGSGGAHAAPAAPGGPVTAMGREGRIRAMLGSPAR